MAIPHFRYSFASGMKKLKVEDAKAVRETLYNYLGCSAESEFSRKKRSYRDMPHHVFQQISKILGEHGVMSDDMWTITPCE